MNVHTKIDKRPMPSKALMRRVAAKLNIKYTSPHDILLRLARKTGCFEPTRIENLNRYALAFLAGGTYSGHEHDTEIHRRNYAPAADYVSPQSFRAADYKARLAAAPMGREDYLDGYRSRLEADERAVAESMIGPFESTVHSDGVENFERNARAFERTETVGPK
jgi:hypothetical protein